MLTTNEVDFLLIGGGLASATAAETLRKEGAGGKITIISAESSLPYHRPPLSKGFLLRKHTRGLIFIHREDFYKENNIDVILGTTALSVHPEEKVVETDNAGEFSFKKLLIATGSYIKKLSGPGANLGGIYYLRTIADAEALRQATGQAKRAVIVGSSFIGMELASTFTKKGVKTTIIAKEGLLYDKLNSPEISEFFVEYYKSRGVEILLGETIKEFRGKKQVEGVTTSSGKEVSCDLIAVGVGVTPEVAFLRGSGIELDDGVVVNEYMQTNKHDIYAAGDVANFFDPVFRRHRRIEHWDNAVKQGQIAAKNMMDKRQPYRDVSYFFSDVFDLSFNFLGDTAGVKERVVRGSTEKKSFSVFYLRDGVIRAAFLLGRPLTEDKAAGSLIQNRVNLKGVKGKLSNTKFPLQSIPTQTVLILQGGGALGAFQCGVVEAMEERQIYPDVVAGVSIGAFNASIIAGNPKNATPALRAFWEEIALNTLELPDEGTRRLLSSWYTLLFGSSRFFRPRWLSPISSPSELPLNWTSFYDPSPVKDLLRKYVDFEKLKDSPIRLIVSAVNVETAELETFDSYVDNVTPDHILASGSLPPGFPWTTIDGKHYWDGGIVSNTPLDQVIELCGLTGRKVYIVNLYARNKPLPQSMPEVLARRDEIFYSEKIRKDIRTKELIENYRKLVEGIMNYLEPETASQIRQRPLYIQTMGDSAPISITRIVHEGEEGEPPSKDYDFSRKTVEGHIMEGYRVAKRILDEESAVGISAGGKEDIEPI
ncbi:MAG TPA: FAD-dependent oxidoreductase [Thermodesulfobacteriota bacterium]|nr:FAD-dependent oxidoreductase [Thermodesulfobacteriota bacterium]